MQSFYKLDSYLMADVTRETLLRSTESYILYYILFYPLNPQKWIRNNFNPSNINSIIFIKYRISYLGHFDKRGPLNLKRLIFFDRLYLN